MAVKSGFLNNEYKGTVFEGLTPPSDDGSVESMVYAGTQFSEIRCL